MTISSIKKQYKELKTELKICKIGGLFLALYRNKEVPKLMMKSLENDDDLEGFFQFPVDMDEKKIPFPILFEQTFEPIGNESNIFHILGIEENLSSEAVKEFLGYLQYARERLKAKPYSLVFWITPDFEKKLFFQAPDFHHWVFGTYDFTDIDDDELNRLNSSVNKELLDVHKIDKYLEKVVWQYQNWEAVKKNNESFLLEPMERSDLYNYYVQSYCLDKQGKEQLLDDLLDKFIEDSKQNFLTLLGDFGTGKSSFSIHYFIKFAKKYLNHKNERIPIFISLKDYKWKLNIEDFMVREFYEKFKIQINFSIFQQLALQGKFIFFIDGFDEMASLTDQEITIQNLKELTKLSFENVLFMTTEQHKPYKANKVFLTSRTHYFLTESQEQTILRADYTILYRNYATKSNYEITRIELKKFNENQIREYIQKHTNNEEITTQYLKIIDNTYNLKELSTRPLLLEMIIKTMPILKEKKNINPADLYIAYTNIWIERDDWRSQMNPQGKRSFMWKMAVNMFELGGDFSLHYSKLDKPNDEHLKPNFEGSEQDYYKYESTTCTFLNRDPDGNYKFIHKSFMEYFIAESFYWHLRKYNTKILDYSSLNTEIKFFLNHIIALHKDKLDALDLRNFNLFQINLSSGSLNQSNLRDAYLRDAYLGDAYLGDADLSEADLRGADLSDAILSGAILRGAILSGAILSGADLSDADLSDADLSDADLSDADLSGAKLSGAILRNTTINEETKLDDKWRLVQEIVTQGAEGRDLSGADLSGAHLSGAHLSGADLSGADLSRAHLSGADLSGAHLSGADLSGAHLSDADLSRAHLSGINLSFAHLRGVNLRGAHLRGAHLSFAHLRGAHLSGINLRDADLSFAYLSGTNLSGADLSRAHLRGADLSGTNLRGADLSGADLRDADLSGTNLRNTKINEETKFDDQWRLVQEIVTQGAVGRDLRGADLRDTDLSRADLSGINLRDADLSGAHLRDTDLSGADLSGINLRGAHLRGAHLSGADLSGTNLSGADLSGADLRDAHLRDAHLRDADLRLAYLRDADLRDADLSGAYLSGVNLSGADLSGVNLSGAHLSGAYLSGAHLSGAHLRDADLRLAYLRDADLSDADLSDTNLRDANLSGTNLRDAYLRDADLSDADLSDADLSGADLSDTNLRDANLSGTNLIGSNLIGAEVENARFGGNLGISESMKRDLIERGAIFAWRSL